MCGLALLLGLVVILTATEGRAQAQGGLFKAPFVPQQVAFANGFQTAVKYLQAEMKAGRLTQASLDALAANRRNALVNVIVVKAKEYQQRLIKLNPNYPAVKKAAPARKGAAVKQ